MGITHVIRGDDHVTNTGVQIALFKALGAEPPAFGHHNLLTTASGEGLSKRTGALSIAGLREYGIEPMARRLAGGAGRHVGKRRGRRRPWRNWRSASTSPSTSKSAVEIRSGRSHRAQPRAAACRCRLRRRATGWRCSASPATRPSRSGWRCAAISTGSPMPANWWRILREGPRDRSRSFPTKDTRIRRDGVRSAAARAVGRRHLEALDGRGQGRDRAARARRCSCRCGWRLLGLSSGPELADLLPLLGREGTLARRP